MCVSERSECIRVANPRLKPTVPLNSGSKYSGVPLRTDRRSEGYSEPIALGFTQILSLLSTAPRFENVKFRPDVAHWLEAARSAFARGRLSKRVPYGCGHRLSSLEPAAPAIPELEGRRSICRGAFPRTCPSERVNYGCGGIWDSLQPVSAANAAILRTEDMAWVANPTRPERKTRNAWAAIRTGAVLGAHPSAVSWRAAWGYERYLWAPVNTSKPSGRPQMDDECRISS